MTPRVLGVDACKTGWIGIVLGPAGFEAHTAGRIDALVAAAGPVEVVGIDIPIGLPDASRRRGDVLAQRAVGARRSSVFLTPTRAALLAPDHATAVLRNRELCGDGVSIQAYSLRMKILEVDAWIRTTPLRVIEVHPELVFATMAGAALAEPKVSWNGAEHRRALLAAQGIDLRGPLGAAGREGRVDDVLDAAAVAWTARRAAAGLATALPDPPEVFTDGWPAAIWA